jgi:hypothetical protein
MSKTAAQLDLEILIAERRVLTDALANCPGGFPGSAAAKALSKAEQALAAFDASHPEVLPAIRAAKRAAREHRYED